MRISLSILFSLLTAFPLFGAGPVMLETQELVVVYDEGLEPAVWQVRRDFPVIRQELETLISEEALLLAKFLRHERKEWLPRTVNLPIFSS